MTEAWITTEEAVELSGYHIVHLRRLLRSGAINGRKFGPVWQVSKSSLLAYLQTASDSSDKRRGPHR